MGLSAFAAVKDNPGGKVIAKVLEAVLHTGRNEEYITLLTSNIFSIAVKSAFSGDDYIKLVLFVRGLPVYIFWCKVLHLHGAVS